MSAFQSKWDGRAGNEGWEKREDLHTMECWRKQKIADLHQVESHVLSMCGIG